MHLKLSNNNIKEIRENTFVNLPKLTTILLYGNGMREIKGQYFYGLTENVIDFRI